jgi:hypothetical protein
MTARYPSLLIPAHPPFARFARFGGFKSAEARSAQAEAEIRSCMQMPKYSNTGSPLEPVLGPAEGWTRVHGRTEE